MGKAKVVRKHKEADGSTSWTELSFERSGGFKTKYKEPSLKAGKYGITLYKTSFINEQRVKLFSNGSKIAIVADKDGPKKLKANKANTSVSIGGKKLAGQLNLEVGAVLSGTKGEVAGQEGWIFE